jgi:pyruvate dehydrogenase E2 component (dihydrolipoamide acetyltransferase)
MRKITVPKRGMGTAPFTIVEWKAKEGEKIEKGAIVVVLESEKITHEVETEISGYVHVLYNEDSEVPIGTVIAMIAETKEELEALQKEGAKQVKSNHAFENQGTHEIKKTREMRPQGSGPSKGRRNRISPLARRLAKEHDIDIAIIKGTGPGGSIVRNDIELAIREKESADTHTNVYQGKRIKEKIPLKGMRKNIAEHLKKSLSVSAQVTAMGEVDMTELIKVRESFLENEESIGTRITYTDLFVFLAARALKAHQIINSSIIEEEIIIWDNINIGVATALDEGLIVPVVKDADKKTLPEISQSIKALTHRAREGRLSFDDVAGGTFTITNLGALTTGYRFETVIINQPESAILGTGGITERAVVKDNKVLIRPIMTYYFTYDHRAINGADAAKFITDLIGAFENPDPLLFR